MKPILQFNLRSILFILSLTLLGISLAILFAVELSKKEVLAYILIAASAFFTSISFYLEILKRRKNDLNKQKEY